MAKLNVTFFTDPGHGWLRVPKALLEKMDILQKMSACSYEAGRYCYLEEDCDAAIFVTAYGRDNLDIKESYVNAESHIRQMARISTS